VAACESKTHQRPRGVEERLCSTNECTFFGNECTIAAMHLPTGHIGHWAAVAAGTVGSREGTVILITCVHMSLLMIALNTGHKTGGSKQGSKTLSQ